MDEGAVTAVKYLGPKPGMTILDLCAAPGGKTFACACLTEGTGRIDAFDIHPHKIKLMNETISRMGFTHIRVAISDAEKVDPARKESADAVLLDAPCSGLGTIRKRPEVKYKHSASAVAELVKKQRAMLATASEYVKPGGVLVYCTCTVSKEENSDNVQWFTKNFPFVTVEPEYPLSNSGMFIRESNAVMLLPSPHHDAFFIAKFKRADG
jgi:16S rRNA (cytosine967-C5)-methyltransferase